MPGWSGSNRREELPRDWESVIRPRILQRDGFRCQHIRFDTDEKCGRYANQVDHIKGKWNHSDSNLQALCHYHHLQKSGAEGGRASQSARRARQGPTVGARKHPGIVD